MKKIIYLLICSAILSNNPAMAAEQENSANTALYTCTVKNELSEQANQLNAFLADYFNTFQKQDIKDLGDLYADIYVSGDKFNKTGMLDLIEKSWATINNYKYEYKVQDIRFDRNFASVEITESTKGLTKNKSDITKDNGIIENNSKTVLYLQKFGKGWKIITDKVLYEQTVVRYGLAKDIAVDLSAPEVVLDNTNYSISLNTNVPENIFVLGAITNEPIVYPLKNAEEFYKQVPPEINNLERLVKSNDISANEMAVASVSFCQAQQSNTKVPEINVTGTAVVLKRVNVE